MIAQLNREYVSTAGLPPAIRRLAAYVFFEGRPAVVRGQWFNPVVRANLGLGMRLGIREVDRPVFVVGIGRSGTTHLSRLLSAHRDVAWLNEPKLIWNMVRGDEDVSGFYAPRGRFRLEARDATPDVRARAQKLFGYFLSVVRAPRLVDKYPEMTYRIPFLKALFPDCKIVAIVRRPDDFVHSVLAWNERNAHDGQDWWGVGDSKWGHMRAELVPSDPAVDAALPAAGERAPSPAEKAATEWSLGMRSILASRDQIDEIVRYEDLALHPHKTIEGLLETCELAPSPEALALARRSTSSRLRDERADFGALGAVVADTREAIGV
ncbi:sulfotransferase family protein [Myceligenerans pegani]|uniref:Sulfotransferase n=1 Tax=Myceligenerans pegani TaxID=2776917 RepID=A0ABR9MWS6_9MICO|nr:sulfotransferase [Myceligenerans sp. TRM 65318]MBE1875227.1 sulfotransferase [Myceligenerans sp. TRM 65318]MBE3017498.1 sulfotransferase [Myceligenerans sp. TRM 65318]